MRQKFKIPLFVSFLAFYFLTSCEKNEVTSISLDKPNFSILVGELDTLKATISTTGTGDIDQYPVTWESCCPYVVSVNKQGVITGLAEGTVTITARAGNKSTFSTVTCKGVATSIDIYQSEINIIAGLTYKLNAVIKCNGNNTDALSTWSTSDPNVATISTNGIVKGISKGSAIIYLKSGNISDSTIVFVDNKIPIQGFRVAAYTFYADFRDCGNGNWLITKNCFMGSLLIIETGGIPERQNLGITITTSLSADKTMIPDGTYTVDTNNTSGADLQPYKIIPERFGKGLSFYTTWYNYGFNNFNDSLKIKSGYIKVLKTGQTSYDIEYNLIDNYNNTYQGTRKGEIYF